MTFLLLLSYTNQDGGIAATFAGGPPMCVPLMYIAMTKLLLRRLISGHSDLNWYG
jgi:hypothetical protein